MSQDSNQGTLSTTTDFVEAIRPLVELVTASVGADSTKYRYRVKLTQFFQWWEAHGRHPLSRHLVHQFVEDSKARGVPAFDIGHVLTPVKKLAREAAYAGLLDAAQLDGILRVKAPAIHGTRLGNWLTEEQVQAMMALPDRSTLNGKRDIVILGLLLYCGLRRDEALRVRFEHVRIVEQRPCLVNLIGKGDKMRSVPMPAWLFRAIQEWIDAAGLTDGHIIRALPGWNAKVIGPGRMSKVGLWDVVKRYAKKLGIAEVVPHDLRRSFGRIARKNGVPLDQIQQCYGHANLRTTQNYLGDTLDFDHPPCDALPAPQGY